MWPCSECIEPISCPLLAPWLGLQTGVRQCTSYILILFFFSRTYDSGLQDVLIINWRTSLGDTALRELQNWLRENVPDASACTGSYPGSITHPQRNRQCNCCIWRWDGVWGCIKQLECKMGSLQNKKRDAVIDRCAVVYSNITSRLWDEESWAAGCAARKDGGAAVGCELNRYPFPSAGEGLNTMQVPIGIKSTSKMRAGSHPALLTCAGSVCPALGSTGEEIGITWRKKWQ